MLTPYPTKEVTPIAHGPVHFAGRRLGCFLAEPIQENERMGGSHEKEDTKNIRAELHAKALNAIMNGLHRRPPELRAKFSHQLHTPQHFGCLLVG